MAAIQNGQYTLGKKRPHIGERRETVGEKVEKFSKKGSKRLIKT